MMPLLQARSFTVISTQQEGSRARVIQNTPELVKNRNIQVGESFRMQNVSPFVWNCKLGTLQLRLLSQKIEVGIKVWPYHTDNGIYLSDGFLKELQAKGQCIKMSGVSTQFQN